MGLGTQAVLQASLSSLGQGNPSLAPGKSVCTGEKIWRSRDGGESPRAEQEMRDRSTRGRTERGSIRAETRVEMGRVKEKAGAWGQSSLQ